MRLQSLIHLVRLVGEMASSKSIGVFGSASLLATYPALGEGGMPLERTFDADLLVQPTDELTARMLREAVGEGSAFFEKNGCHADILRPEILETLPQGWGSRRVPLPSVPAAKCLHPLDLALVKLVLGREKDLALLRALLDLKLLDAESLRRHYHATPLGEREALAADATCKNFFRRTDVVGRFRFARRRQNVNCLRRFVQSSCLSVMMTRPRRCSDSNCDTTDSMRLERLTVTS